MCGKVLSINLLGNQKHDIFVLGVDSVNSKIICFICLHIHIRVFGIKLKPHALCIYIYLSLLPLN